MEENPPRGEKEEEEAFLVSLYKFMKERHTPIERIPHLGFKQSTWHPPKGRSDTRVPPTLCPPDPRVPLTLGISLPSKSLEDLQSRGEIRRLRAGKRCPLVSPGCALGVPESPGVSPRPPQVTGRRLWKNVYDELGGSRGSTSAATCTRRHYER